MRILWFIAIVAFFAPVAAQPAQSESLRVDTEGVVARILFEAVIDGGHVPEFVDKYKLRVTEIAIAAGGHVGDHNHLGPGIRQMTEGSMDYLLPDRTVTYDVGDFFFQTGDVSHRVEDVSGTVSKHLLFEVLPIEVEGASLILPKGRQATGVPSCFPPANARGDAAGARETPRSCGGQAGQGAQSTRRLRRANRPVSAQPAGHSGLPGSSGRSCAHRSARRRPDAAARHRGEQHRCHSRVGVKTVPPWRTGSIRRDLRRRIARWRRVLRRHAPQGQQILRKLIDGRLLMTPYPDQTPTA